MDGSCTNYASRQGATTPCNERKCAGRGGGGGGEEGYREDRERGDRVSDCVCVRERWRHTDPDRQTSRQTDGQTGGQTEERERVHLHRE